MPPLLPMNNTPIGIAPGVETSGAILLDGVMQSFFLGLVLAQVSEYWTDYHDDSWRKRVYVAVVVVLSILQTVLEDYKLWTVLVLHRTWSTCSIQWTDLFLNGMICSLCEAFFIRRCWKMTNRSSWVLYPLYFLSATIIAANIYLAASVQISMRGFIGSATEYASDRHMLPSAVISFSYWIFGSLALDATVTAILVFTLWRSKTGLREADKMISQIINITWESAALPSFSMLVAVALYHAQAAAKDHLVLFFVLMTGKLYTLGLLRTLNSRVNLRQRFKSHDLGRTSLTEWTWDQSTTRRPSASTVIEPPRTFDSNSPIRSNFEFKSSTANDPDYLSPDEPVTSRRRESARDIQFVSSESIDARERGLSGLST